MTTPDAKPNRQSGSHRRHNPLTGEWVLVSPQRLRRPWQGATSTPDAGAETRPSYDPECYLCPGNARADGGANPNYTGVYVFDNDFPALQSEPSGERDVDDSLFAWRPAEGVCRVICFSPDHSRTLSALSAKDIAAVVDTWAAQSEELGRRFPHGSVQIFENKGELMGCSNPHPHGQIWAQRDVPTLLSRELENCAKYYRQRNSALLSDYVTRELELTERLVCENEHFVALVPYWASWPYEILLCPKRSVARLPLLSNAERASFAALLKNVSIRYDNLFRVSFPYSAGLHQAPASGDWDKSFTLHMHFFPPLLRSATVKKFMVGYEMLAEAQRDLTPEHAAQTLRDLPAKLR